MSAPVITLLLAAAGGPSNEQQMATCIWQQAPVSAATLLARVKFDARYVHDAEGSPTVGPLMRVLAACDRQAKGFPAVSGKPLAWTDYSKLLKTLKKTRPQQVGAEQFAEPVYRCTIDFSDAPPGGEPAEVVWGYGDAASGRQIKSTARTFGVKLSPADAAALLGSDPTAAMERMSMIQPLLVTTKAAGEASGKPYAVDPKLGVRKCQQVAADGSYSDV